MPEIKNPSAFDRMGEMDVSRRSPLMDDPVAPVHAAALGMSLVRRYNAVGEQAAAVQVLVNNLLDCWFQKAVLQKALFHRTAGTKPGSRIGLSPGVTVILSGTVVLHKIQRVLLLIL